MFFQIHRYLTFLFKSTNQHGVHSPFVYNLVTKCLYKKEKSNSYRSIKLILKKTCLKYKVGKLLNRIPRYFECKNILVLEDQKEAISKVLAINNSISIDKEIQSERSYDMIYLTLGQLENHLSNDSLFSLIHNNSVIIINSIYNSETDILIWKKIKKHPKLMITIDTFYLGLIFIRKEQAKEHFTIRL